jgi:hypothetical protein
LIDRSAIDGATVGTEGTSGAAGLSRMAAGTGSGIGAKDWKEGGEDWTDCIVVERGGAASIGPMVTAGDAGGVAATTGAMLGLTGIFATGNIGTGACAIGAGSASDDDASSAALLETGGETVP